MELRRSDYQTCFLCQRSLSKRPILKLFGDGRMETCESHHSSATTPWPSLQLRSSQDSLVPQEQTSVLLVHRDCFLLLKRHVPESHPILWRLGILLSPEFSVRVQERQEKQKALFVHCFGAAASFEQAIQPNHPDKFFFSKHFLGLPVELRLSIATLVWPCDYQYPALILCEHRRLVKTLVDDRLEKDNRLEKIDWKDPYSLRHTSVGGTKYLCGIYKGSNNDPWFEPKPGFQSKVIICYGELGVVDLQLLEEKEPGTKNRNAIWYKVLRNPTIVKFDLKPLIVRDVHLLMPEQKPQIWDTPNPVILQEHNTFKDYTRQHNTPYGLKRVALENISGISVCFRAGAITSIHSHPDAKGQTVESELPPLDGKDYFKLVYIFLPFHKSECISRILIRRQDDQARAAVLVVRMSSGRSFTLGPHVPPEDREFYSFTSLQSKTDGDVTDICYSKSLTKDDVCAEVIAIACRNLSSISVRDDPLLWPTDLQGPPGASGFEWFYSEAQLSNIASVKLCTNTSQTHHPIVGMMITYEDGSVAVLGQWYATKALHAETHIVRGSKTLSWTSEPIRSRTFVKEVMFDGNAIHLSSSSVTVKLQGKLVWWFTNAASYLEKVSG